MSAHTSGPWMWTTTGPHMADDYTQPYAISEHGKANLIAGVFGDVQGGDDIAQANAEFIVRACNAHDDLLAALKTVIANHCPNDRVFCGSCSAARDIIAKAEGRSPETQG